MKKRLLLISLALVLALTMLMPSAALADNGRRVSGGDFTGYGQLFVTYMPDPTVKGPIWRYSGETAGGYLAQCDWDLLAGTAFDSVHDSIVYVDSLGNARGVMKGTFTIMRGDGSILSGTFNGRIKGNLFTMVILDEGTWRSTAGTGAFENVKAWGKWSGNLGLVDLGGGQFTLGGPLTWQGKYLTR